MLQRICNFSFYVIERIWVLDCGRKHWIVSHDWRVVTVVLDSCCYAFYKLKNNFLNIYKNDWLIKNKNDRWLRIYCCMQKDKYIFKREPAWRSRFDKKTQSVVLCCRDATQRKNNNTIKLLGGIFVRFHHLVLDVPWHALFTFEIGRKDFQIIQLKLYPSRDPMPFLSSAYWAAPTEKKHLTALTVNEANALFALFIKAPFWRLSSLVLPNLRS